MSNVKNFSLRRTVIKQHLAPLNLWGLFALQAIAELLHFGEYQQKIRSESSSTCKRFRFNSQMHVNQVSCSITGSYSRHRPNSRLCRTKLSLVCSLWGTGPPLCWRLRLVFAGMSCDVLGLRCFRAMDFLVLNLQGLANCAHWNQYESICWLKWLLDVSIP